MSTSKSFSCGVVVLVAVMLAAIATAQSDSFLLSPGRAGQIEVGMPVDDLYRIVGRDQVRLVDLFSEGMFTPAIEIRLAGASAAPAMIAPIREWPCGVYALSAVDVWDQRFRTAEGIGAGSTLGDLRQRYETRLSDEEGPHAWVESIQMNFRLENSSRRNSVRVRSVWIPGNPVAVRKARCPERGLLGHTIAPPNLRLQPTAVALTLKRRGSSPGR